MKNSTTINPNKKSTRPNKRWRIRASAPCRIDVGGTWDLKAFALPYEYIKPSTVNFALDMRTTVDITPYKDGLVKVSDKYSEEVYPLDEMPFDTNFRLVFAIVSYFQLSGLEIKISYEGPPRSGLGGSGVLGVCIVAALDKVGGFMGRKSPSLSKRQIVQIAHDIEDGLHFSHTGLQDQCAAAYGGINSWVWCYTSPLGKYTRTTVLSKKHYPKFASRLTVAYVGQTHTSSDVNKEQVASFQNGKTRGKWLRINQLTSEFAESIRKFDWETAAKLIQEENDIRLSMVPRRITPVGEILERATKEIGGGFSIAGAGNGGCVWAICPDLQQVKELKSRWKEILGNVSQGKLLDIGIDEQGLVVTTHDR